MTPSLQWTIFCRALKVFSFQIITIFDQFWFAVTHLDPAWIAIMGSVWLLVAFDKHRFPSLPSPSSFADL